MPEGPEFGLHSDTLSARHKIDLVATKIIVNSTTTLTNDDDVISLVFHQVINVRLVCCYHQTQLTESGAI